MSWTGRNGSRSARVLRGRSARGEPMMWVTGAGLVICVTMMLLVAGWILFRGGLAFWPREVVAVTTTTGETLLGEVVRSEPGADGEPERLLFRSEAGGGPSSQRSASIRWIDGANVVERERPNWAVVVDRTSSAGPGRVCGYPVRYAEVVPIAVPLDTEAPARGSLAAAEDLVEELAPDAEPLWWFVQRDGEANRRLVPRSGLVPKTDVCLGLAVRVREGSAAAWRAYLEVRDDAAASRERLERLRRDRAAEIGSRAERARDALRLAVSRERSHEEWAEARRRQVEAELAGDAAGADRHGRVVAAAAAALGEPSTALVDAFRVFRAELRTVRVALDELAGVIEEAERRAGRHLLEFSFEDGGGRAWIPVAEILRAYPPNQMSAAGKVGVLWSRWVEFVSTGPRGSNLEGGVYPAIFGTVLLTLLMCLLVLPLGVLAALYLHEYAPAGPWTAMIRIAITNLAGVPGVVFGVFGLGFFCHVVGVSIDELLFAERLPAPTFGKGGMLWSAATLAFLTLPVVIVATEEALAAVPGSAREASYACGASRFETIRRIVLPRAAPGILTGAILAMARGAGEVAPLMLVGAVKLAPELPIASRFPFGLEQSFMHLGYQVFDLSQGSDPAVARPLVYSTALLLISIIAALNLGAIVLRGRLRRRFLPQGT